MNDKCIIFNNKITPHRDWPEDLKCLVNQAVYATTYIDTLCIWIFVPNAKDLYAQAKDLEEKFQGIENHKIVPIEKAEADTSEARASSDQTQSSKRKKEWNGAGISITLQTPSRTDLKTISEMQLPNHVISRVDIAVDFGFESSDTANSFRELWLKIAKVKWSGSIKKFLTSTYTNFRNASKGNSSIIYSEKKNRLDDELHACHWEFRSRKVFLKSRGIRKIQDIPNLLEKKFIFKMFSERVSFYDLPYDYLDKIIERRYTKDEYQKYKEMKRKNRLNVSMPNNRPEIFADYLRKIKKAMIESGTPLDIAYYTGLKKIENLIVLSLKEKDDEL
ncbi:hypothetical protein [Candidatus Magnetaquicoccus inordinatus]|uniref:hypothetical protein n=1 Tax=Candidatus Magnetaquicoccus inordinatus TaxID=2496818 RepID=UPI00102B46F3|nr:hypothetical protein [Candidatus Magnetaquicoccus inordinatus]